jgi:hypothetical protein
MVNMCYNSIAKFIRTAGLTSVLWAMFFPFQASAVCCRCHAAGSSDTICLFVSDPDCPPNLTAKYPKLAGMSCDSTSYVDTECRSIKDGGFCKDKGEAALYDPKASAGTQGEIVTPEEQQTIKKFSLPSISTNVPGLQLSAAKLVNGKISIPFLAQYISAFYNFSIGLAVVVAALMIIYGGFLYILGGSMPSISSGKQKIVDATIGLLLVISAYTLLYIVNPATVQPKPLAIMPAKQTLMEKEMMTLGFSFEPAIEQNQKLNVPINGMGESLPSATQVTVVPQGGTPPEGANGTITDVVEPSGTPAQRLRAYCTSKGAASKAKTYDEKISLLVRAVLGFKKICIDEKSCIYLRGGYWNGTKVVAGASDVPFILAFLSAHTEYANAASNPSVWDRDCIANYDRAECFQNQTGNVCNPSEKCAPYAYIPAPPKCGDQFPTRGKCYQQAKNIYIKELVDRLNSNGWFGSDCGGTILSIYECAGAVTSRPLDHYTMWAGRGKGPDFPVYGAKNYDDFVKQLRASSPDGNGNFKFGDIITVDNPIHVFMYTGGRSDVPFEIFEMGGGGPRDMIPEGQSGYTVPGLKGAISGMKATPKLPVDGDAMLKYIKWWYDRGTKNVAVARPYNFVSCESKNECADDEICQCAFWDAPKDKWGKNNCGMQGACHKTKLTNPAMPCENDEHCAKGWSCVKEKGRSDCKKNQ